MNRCRKCFFDRPISQVESFPECSLAHPQASSPLCESKSSSFKRNVVINSSIVGLSKRVSIPAIFSSIVSVCIFSIYGKVLWTFTHVSIEILKLIPSIANLYASSAIVVKAYVLLVFAPLMHLAPYFIRSRFTHAVSSASLYKHLFRMASTTFSMACSQFVAFYNSVIIAFTNAIPKHSTSRVFGAVDHCQIVKLLPSKINKIMGNSLRHISSDWILTVKKSVAGITDMLFGSRLPIHSAIIT